MKVKVITITNQKGGTGKTTFAALLSIGLTLHGNHVLMIDLDPQGHLSSLFFKPDELLKFKGFFHLARREEYNIETIKLNIKNREYTMRIIPSNLHYVVDMYRGQFPLMNPYILRQEISQNPFIQKNIDYVICDTPPELFTPTLWGLYSADYLIIPSNLDPLSLRGTLLLIKDVIPDISRISQNLKLLGIPLIKVKIRRENISLRRRQILNKMIKRYLPSFLINYKDIDIIYRKIIPVMSELRDLELRSKRRGIPLERIINKYEKVRNLCLDIAKETIERIKDLSE